MSDTNTPRPATNEHIYGETPSAGLRPLAAKSVGTEPSPELLNQIKAERERYAVLVKARLGAKHITEIEARDGIRDCFVASYLGGVAQGLDNFALQGDVKQVRGVVEAIFRRRFKSHGMSWEQPTVAGLQAVKDEIDVETHLDSLPPELKGIHDQVCTLLIGKARGDVGHVGDRSVVAASARGEAAATPTPRAFASVTPTAAPAAAPQPPTPAANVPPAAAPAVQPPSQPAAAPVAAAAPAPINDPVILQMRATVATLLEQMVLETRGGASVEALFERAGQLAGLIDALQRLSR